MQASGQYGVPQEYVVQRPPPPHMFSLSHDMTISPSTGHGHPHHLQHPQHQPHHHHTQHQQHHHPQHTPHSQHAQHPQHPQQQQHPQHPHQQHAQQQQQHQQQQHQQQQQQQQQQMVQQLGLGPDSPEAPSPVASRPSPTSYKQRESLGDDDGGEEEGRGTGGNRWPRQETLALIKIRSEMDANFRDSGLKGPLWEDVSRKLAEMGYNRSSKKCKEKFENVHKYYKKTKDGRAGRQDGKSYRFFSQLEALYGGGGVNNHNQQADGGGMMLTGGSGGAIGGGAEGNLSSQRPENSSGVQLPSDSEDDYDDPGDNDNEQGDKSAMKKRKRKEGKLGSSKMMYIEGLVKKLMEKQEAMQRKFLDAIERREQDRLVREEAWKRQEMARMTREHELRAQEHALAATRDAALVSFLHKVTGQTLQLPQIAPPLPLVVVQQPSENVNQPPSSHNHGGIGDDHGIGGGGGQEKESFDPNSKRWPKPEVHALIRLRSQMEPRFQEAGPKGPLWEEISTGMACLGHNRNAKRCKEKWENINKYFRKTKETNKKRPDNAKTCPYFHQLDMLYRKGVLGNPSSKLNKLDDNSDELLDHPSQGGGGRGEDSGGGGGAGGTATTTADATEILAMMPTGDGPVGAGASTSNGGGGATTHFFSSPDNGSSGDRGSKKVKKLQQNVSSGSNGNHVTPLALNIDGVRGDGEMTFSGNDKSVRLEGLVKGLLEQQQQQQQRFEEDFERREQEREMREHERRQEEDYRFAQERARTSSRDVALMALVHKLAAGDSTDFAISAPSSSE